MRRFAFLIWFLVGAFTAFVVAVLVAASGMIPMAASGEVGPLDRIGHIMWNASVAQRAPETDNPFAGDELAVAGGFTEYRAMCVHCHGAPGVERAPWVSGMQPLPPDLASEEVQARSDGELRYIIEHGVRMTGMPPFGSHGDDELWQIVAFLRTLPQLTEARRQALSDAVARHGHAGHDGSGGGSGDDHGHVHAH